MLFLFCAVLFFFLSLRFTILTQKYILTELLEAFRHGGMGRQIDSQAGTNSKYSIDMYTKVCVCTDKLILDP